jgi:hypothetical protein
VDCRVRRKKKDKRQKTKDKSKKLKARIIPMGFPLFAKQRGGSKGVSSWGNKTKDKIL